jgi:WD40 repeat protein
MRWDLKKGKPIRRFNGHADIVTSLGINLGSFTAVTGGYDKSVIVWNLGHPSVPKGENVHKGSVSVRLLDDGKRALTSGWHNA